MMPKFDKSGGTFPRVMQTQLAPDSTSTLAKAAQLQDNLPVVLLHLLPGTAVRPSTL